MVNSVEAVTRIRPRQNLAFGYAVVALNPNACSGNQNGAGFRGSTLTTVDGGGIWSNGCMDEDGNGPNFEIEVKNAGAYYCSKPNNETFSNFTGTVPVKTDDGSGNCVVIPPEAYLIDPPDCTDGSAYNVTATQFENAAINGSGLAPGLWCVTGDVKFNAGDVVNGLGVTIVFKNGGMTINGGATVNLTAPNTGSDEPAVTGLLFYAPPGNANVIQLNGGAGSHFVGTVLAPSASVEIAGNADTEAIKTQVIAWNVDVGGDAATYIQYVDNQQMQIPTRMDLWR